MMNNSLRPLSFFDFRIGIAGGLVMGLIVFLVNFYSTGDTPGSITAGLKQGVYTFFFGGIIMKLCERLAVGINPGFLAIVLSFLIPSFISLALTFGVHSLKGTPRPVESTIPTALLVVPSTFVWGFMKRSKMEGHTKALKGNPNKNHRL